ncbi:hypothetical protein Gotur_021689 [Gossypium turneri]
MCENLMNELGPYWLMYNVR